MKLSRKLILAVATAGLLVAAVPMVYASHYGDSDWGGGDRYGDGSGDYGDRYGDYDYGDRERRPDQAISYINPDTGAPTENPNIDPGSSCFDPDRYDEAQPLSTPGTTDRNVHNDACFLGDSYSSSWRYSERDRRTDGPATFESFGTGYISACPDPDNGGPKVAITRDTDGDGRVDFCFQSGYQEKGVAGDREFHARMNNDSQPGDQTVVWCYDPDRDGCDDEDIKDVINIRWTDGG
ncbi:MAG: hypothetical protein H0W05_00660 [Thermoleophilaceae bacterium]|nr:hypothetical protein [Thermoleophilaceae bacterium]